MMKKIVTFAAGTLLVVILGGCASTSSIGSKDIGRTASNGRGETALAAEAADEGSAEAVDNAINAVIADPSSRQSLQLLVERRGEQGMISLRVFTSGVSVWNGRRQFRLSEGEIAEMLRELRDADFAGFEDLYGGFNPQDAEPLAENEPVGNAMVVVCRVELELNGFTKSSVQRLKGEQSAELARLAEDLLAIAEGPAGNGVEAADLADGLDKVAHGELAPEVLRLTLVRRPDADSVDAKESGFLLQVRGNDARTQQYEPDTGYLGSTSLGLTRGDLEAIARALAEADPGSLPPNLWAEVYTDLTVEVLNHGAVIQARRFAGLEPNTHGARQRQFDTVVEALVELQSRVAANGAPAD